MRMRNTDNFGMSSLEFIIKFRDQDLSNKMVLPSEIVRRLKEKTELGKIIYLKGPSGNIWEVNLSKKAGKFYLEDDWKDFIKDHSVEEDDFLVFKYCQKSCFTVLIFDTSGCERIASHFAKNNKVCASPKAFQTQNLSTSQSLGVTECSFERKVSHYDTEVHILSDENSFSGGSSSSETDQTLRFSSSGKQCMNMNASEFSSFLKARSRGKESGAAVEAKAHRFAKSISKRNPCFVKVLPPSSVTKKTALGIPREFIVRCKLCKSQTIALQTSHRKKWLVYYSFFPSSASMLYWRDFVKDNRLKEGDVCVFELSVSHSKVAMFVYIFRKC